MIFFLFRKIKLKGGFILCDLYNYATKVIFLMCYWNDAILVIGQ